MNSFTQYLWGIYLLAAMGLIMMLWYSLRRVRSSIAQDVPVVLAIALLLTPASAIPGGAALAPALVVLVFEGLLDDKLSGWRGGLPILLATVSLLLLLFVKYWITAKYFAGVFRSPAPARPGEAAAAAAPERFGESQAARPERAPPEPGKAKQATPRSNQPEIKEPEFGEAEITGSVRIEPPLTELDISEPDLGEPEFQDPDLEKQDATGSRTPADGVAARKPVSPAKGPSPGSK